MRCLCGVWYLVEEPLVFTLACCCDGFGLVSHPLYYLKPSFIKWIGYCGSGLFIRCFIIASQYIFIYFLVFRYFVFIWVLLLFWLFLERKQHNSRQTTSCIQHKKSPEKCITGSMIGFNCESLKSLPIPRYLFVLFFVGRFVH